MAAIRLAGKQLYNLDNICIEQLYKGIKVGNTKIERTADCERFFSIPLDATTLKHLSAKYKSGYIKDNCFCYDGNSKLYEIKKEIYTIINNVKL